MRRCSGVYGADGEEALDHGDQWEDRFSAQIINVTTLVSPRGIDITRGFVCRARALAARIKASVLARVQLKSYCQTSVCIERMLAK